MTLFDIPSYKLIHQGSRCTRNGGLIIYLHEKYCSEVRNLYNSSDIWEGLFIDVTGHNLRKRLTIGNIYRPPHDNNNNKNIETFINEMSPIIDQLKKENSYAAISGDFNINLLQINEREKYDDFFDMMCTNNFYPKIMFPTRIAKRSHSLWDQIFCKVPCKEQADVSAAILLSGISDHFPCVVNFKILNKRSVTPKYIYKRSVTESSIEQYRAHLRNLNIHTHLNADLMTDPNGSYQTFENLMQNTYERHFPQKRVKFNKYQHKLSNWITTGILKSIEFRDNLYKRLKLCPIDSPEYETYKHNLKMYQGYLNQCIRTAKKEYYVKEFTRYKNDIRKTWDTLKGQTHVVRTNSTCFLPGLSALAMF